MYRQAYSSDSDTSSESETTASSMPYSAMGAVQRSPPMHISERYRNPHRASEPNSAAVSHVRQQTGVRLNDIKAIIELEISPDTCPKAGGRGKKGARQRRQSCDFFTDYESDSSGDEQCLPPTPPTPPSCLYSYYQSSCQYPPRGGNPRPCARTSHPDLSVQGHEKCTSFNDGRKR